MGLLVEAREQLAKEKREAALREMKSLVRQKEQTEAKGKELLKKIDDRIAALENGADPYLDPMDPFYAEKAYSRG